MELPISNFVESLSGQRILGHVIRIENIQSLWSDYGAIYRLHLKGGASSSVILKYIDLSQKLAHPRGWSGHHSHQRKLKSYRVEWAWYKNFAGLLPAHIKVPELISAGEEGEVQWMILEDLTPNFPDLKSSCTLAEAETVVKWLAGFHAKFINATPSKLWKTGTYWHLETRPDELVAMTKSELKDRAVEIDQALNAARFQTFVHGDAKVANFCFGGNGQVAAVDFQYVGGGVGVKDLAYFLGSCFSNQACELYEDHLLDFYFTELRKSSNSIDLDFEGLEAEWREMYPLAWADFNRFLLGWMPSHQKLHSHALSKNQEAFDILDELKG